MGFSNEQNGLFYTAEWPICNLRKGCFICHFDLKNKINKA